MAYGPDYTTAESYYAWMCLLYSISTCFTEAAVQGLMVVESRSDATHGGEDLQSIAWLFYSCGGLLCYFIMSSAINPSNKGCFLIAAVSAALLFIGSFFLNKNLESNQAERVVMGCGTRLRLIISGLCYGLKIREIFTAFLFQLIFGIAPVFQIYLNDYLFFDASLPVNDFWRIYMFGWAMTVFVVVLYAVFLQ